MVKYLVTGGCGFIGSHLVDLLVKKGHDVVVLDDLSNSSPRFLPSNVKLFEGCITDAALLKKALKGVEGVFHLAAKVSVIESIQNWHQNHLINSGGTVQLFAQLSHIPVVYASSAAVYGNPSKLPVKEEHPLSALSPYSADKISNELHAQAAWETRKTPSMGFRLFNIYGPRQNPRSPYSGVISIFLDQLLQNRPLTLYGDGTQTRDFVFVKDVAEILLKGMENTQNQAHVFNLCTGNPISINELIEEMQPLYQVHATKECFPQRAGEALFSEGDPSKLLETLKIKPQTSLKKGLTDLMREICPSDIV